MKEKTKKYEKLIFNSKNSPLGSIPFHENSDVIERYCSKNFPVHLAIHEINKAQKKDRNYVKPHKHEKSEINILLGNLKYLILLGDEEYIVQAPANIWIPAGLNHSANLIEGEGHYICIILNDKYDAAGK